MFLNHYFCSYNFTCMKYILSLAGSILIFLAAHAGRADTINVYSRSMQKNIKCVVITPDSYKKRHGKRFPVIYLLHGYSGNYAQWPERAPQLKDKSDELQAIFVCPDGGFNSWYLDSPVDPAIRYETFTANELVRFMDKQYRTLADRKHRAITGLSMGGHGGLYLAIRHKDVFGAAGSTSGGVDFRPFPKNWDLVKILGDTLCCMQNWDDNVVINQLDSLKNKELALIIDCGVKDFFITVNRNLHQKLLSMKIDHDYIERPGGHTSEYWQNSIDYQLLFFKKFFAGN